MRKEKNLIFLCVLFLFILISCKNNTSGEVTPNFDDCNIDYFNNKIYSSNISIGSSELALEVLRNYILTEDILDNEFDLHVLRSNIMKPDAFIRKEFKGWVFDRWGIDFNGTIYQYNGGNCL